MSINCTSHDSQANPTALPLIQTMYQMFFPTCMETPLALVLEVTNVKDSITISHESINKKPAHSFLLHLPHAFQQSEII